MGILSSIGKFFKKIWKGITTGFASLLKPVQKFLNSKVGKVLMLAVSVFSMGSALLAGAKGFMAGQGFIGKFLNGGKEFLNSLLNTEFDTVGGDIAGAGAKAGDVVKAGADSAVQAGDVLTGADPTAMGGVGAAATAGGAVAPVAAPGTTRGMLDAAQRSNFGTPAAAAATEAVKEPGWLSKAMSSAKDFAKSDTGQMIIGNTLQGYSRGKELEAFYDEKSRVANMFEDPNDPGMKWLREHDFNIDVQSGLAAQPGRLAQAEAQRTGRYTPTIPFRHPVGTYAGGQ